MSNGRRVVIDNNIVISRMIDRRGSAAQTFNLLYQFSVLLTSDVILSELRQVMERKKFDRYLDLSSRLRFIHYYAKAATLIHPTAEFRVCRDPRDDKFLEVAVSGHADLIVTGDKDLLVLHPWRGVSILTPTMYLESVQ